jgi:hypothetical protein
MRAIYIEIFFFLSFTLHPPPRVCVRVSTPVNGVKEGKKSSGHGSSRADRPAYDRGNSSGTRLTYLGPSERRPGSPLCVPPLAHAAFPPSARETSPPATTTPHAATTAARNRTPDEARSAA